MLAYWINIKGHEEHHPIKNTLRECREYENSNATSFGRIANDMAEKAGLGLIHIGFKQLQYQGFPHGCS